MNKVFYPQYWSESVKFSFYLAAEDDKSKKSYSCCEIIITFFFPHFHWSIFHVIVIQHNFVRICGRPFLLHVGPRPAIDLYLTKVGPSQTDQNGSVAQPLRKNLVKKSEQKNEPNLLKLKIAMNVYSSYGCVYRYVLKIVSKSFSWLYTGVFLLYFDQFLKKSEPANPQRHKLLNNMP